MNLSLKKTATYSFQVNSPEYKILLHLTSSSISENPEEISEGVGIDRQEVRSVVTQLYNAGFLYSEQPDYYTLSRYGKDVVNYIVNQKQNEHIIPPNVDTYNSVFSLFGSSASIEKPKRMNPTLRKAFNNLIQWGYIVDNGENYELSSLGQAHNKYVQEMTTLSDDYIEAAYNHYKEIHPEYKFVYSIISAYPDNKNIVFNDIRRYVRGTVIAESFSPNNVEIIENWWGGKNIPSHPNIEAAIAKEIQYIADVQRKKGITEAMPSMDDVKTARTYISKLVSKINPGIVSSLLMQKPKGSTISEDYLVEIAKTIVGKSFPSNLDSASVEDAIAQVIKRNRDINIGRFLSTDSVTDIVPVVSNFLREGKEGITAFNLFRSESKHSNTVTEDIFKNKQDFRGLNLQGIILSNVSISNVDFSNCDFSHASLDSSKFSRCNFTNAIFTSANVKGTKFSYCNFDKANFENAGGIGDPSTEFTDNTGTAINFYAITGEKSSEDFKLAVKQPQKAHLTIEISDSEKELAKILVEHLQQFIYKTAILRRMMYKLSFIAIADRKQDILNILNPQIPIAEWITKDVLVDMIKNGDLANLGIDPKLYGRLIGRVAQQEKQKQEAEPKSRYEEFSEMYKPEQKQFFNFSQKLNEFLNANRDQHFIPRDGLLNIIPETARDIRGLLSAYNPSLTLHNLEEFTLQLTKAIRNISNDSSPKVTAEKAKLHPFAYTSRISSIIKSEYGDRGDIHLDYPDTFGLILEPSVFGVTDPDVRKMIDALTVHAMWRENQLHPAAGHWKNAVASSRISPYIVEQKDIALSAKNVKKVWVMVELQSDPYQKRIYNLGRELYPDWEVPKNIAWREDPDVDKNPGILTINSEPHRVLSMIEKLSQGSKFKLDTLLEWAKKDSTFLNNAFQKAIEQLDVDEAMRSDFQSVLKMLTKDKVAPAVLFTPKTGNEKKSYPRIKNGKDIANLLVSKNLATPVFIQNSDLPTYVGSDGKPFNSYQVNSFLIEHIDTLIASDLKEILTQLSSSELIDVTKTTVRLLPYGSETNHVYDKLSKFRQHYRDWPETLILEAINRAIDLGIDEIWIVSASDYERSPGTTRDLSVYYDKPAQRFTKTVISPPFEITDKGSTLWTGVGEEYQPKHYYVIKISDWKQALKTGSLRSTASKYTNFVQGYLESVGRKFPFLNSVPKYMLVESAFAYLLDKVKDELSEIEFHTAQQDINSMFHVNLGGIPFNYVEAILLGKKNLDKSLVSIVKKTGEEPYKLAIETFMYFLSVKYPSIPAELKVDLVEVFRTIIDNNSTEFLGEAQKVYDDLKETGFNPSGEGDISQFVNPSGEALPPGETEEDAIDKLIQQQKIEQEKAKEEDIQFTPPSIREQHKLVEEEINRLLDALQKATTEEEKNRIRKRLHEISTLAHLKSKLFTFSDIASNIVYTSNTNEIKVLFGVYCIEQLLAYSSIIAPRQIVDIAKQWLKHKTPELVQQANIMADNISFKAWRSSDDMDEVVYLIMVASSWVARSVRAASEERDELVNSCINKARHYASEAATKAGVDIDFDGLKNKAERDILMYTHPNIKSSTIVHEDGKWKVKTKDKSRTLGTHDTEEEAKAQLRAIEINKKHSNLIFSGVSGPSGASPRDENTENEPEICLKKMVKNHEKPLTFSAIDQEFNTPKDINKGDTPRNDPFQYEPAHGEAAPVGGGSKGINDSTDNSNMDMKGGFYTDLNLPDPHKKDKMTVQFEPSNHVNLQPSFIASFDFSKFKSRALSGLRAVSEFRYLSDEEITNRLIRDYEFAKREGLL